MKKFEYNAIPLVKAYCHKGLAYEVDPEVLNELGLEGWELVQVVSNQLIFKREMVQESN